MPHSFQFRKRVEFAETDMAGIVHFSNYFRYMEAAEHAFFRSLGLSVHATIDGREVGFPRAEATCRYLAPLRFEDEVEIELTVSAKSGKSITCSHTIRRVDGDARTDVAIGKIVLVCVEIDPAEGLKAIEIPESIDALLEVAPNT